MKFNFGLRFRGFSPLLSSTVLFGVLASTLAAQWKPPNAVRNPARSRRRVNRRVGSNSTVFVPINLKNVGQDVKLPGAMKSLLDTKEVTHVLLPHYGVAILAEQGKH
jgi:hypothetical protein